MSILELADFVSNDIFLKCFFFTLCFNDILLSSSSESLISLDEELDAEPEPEPDAADVASTPSSFSFSFSFSFSVSDWSDWSIAL